MVINTDQISNGTDSSGLAKEQRVQMPFPDCPTLPIGNSAHGEIVPVPEQQFYLVGGDPLALIVCYERRCRGLITV